MKTRQHHVFQNFEIFTVVILAIDSICHFCISRDKKGLLSRPIFILQILTVLMMIASMISKIYLAKGGRVKPLTAIYISAFIRLVGSFLLFRIVRLYRLMNILLLSIIKSFKELLLLLCLVMILVLLCSGLVYYAELTKDTFDNMTDAYWWALITMTTVGYGDVVPKCSLGRLAGALCAVCGVVTLAIPIAVIGGNFSKCYSMVFIVDRQNKRCTRLYR